MISPTERFIPDAAPLSLHSKAEEELHSFNKRHPEFIRAREEAASRNERANFIGLGITGLSVAIGFAAPFIKPITKSFLGRTIIAIIASIGAGFASFFVLGNTLGRYVVSKEEKLERKIRETMDIEGVGRSKAEIIFQQPEKKPIALSSAQETLQPQPQPEALASAPEASTHNFTANIAPRDPSHAAQALSDAQAASTPTVPSP